MPIVPTIVILLAIGIGWLIHRRRRARRRLAYIESYQFHPSLRRRWRLKHPSLSEEEENAVFEGLRDFFWACQCAGKRMVAMPSQVVDDGWHEFILFSRAYAEFCRNAFGRFLHHTPAEAMRTPTQAQEGIKRAWRLCCRREKIKPHQPDRLPRLFALDAQLAIAGGFFYSLDCMAAQAAAADGLHTSGRDGSHCGSAIGCTSCSGYFDGVDSDGGDGGGDSDGGDGGGCGGGCGGD